MIISKLYAFHSRSTNLILTGLSGTANNFWYGSIRGDTLNGILQATAGEKIESKKRVRNDRYIGES